MPAMKLGTLKPVSAKADHPYRLSAPSCCSSHTDRMPGKRPLDPTAVDGDPTRRKCTHGSTSHHCHSPMPVLKQQHRGNVNPPQILCRSSRLQGKGSEKIAPISQAEKVPHLQPRKKEPRKKEPRKTEPRKTEPRKIELARAKKGKTPRFKFNLYSCKWQEPQDSLKRSGPLQALLMLTQGRDRERPKTSRRPP